MIFKQQLANISTVLNNTGNTTKLLTSFNALDVAQQKVLLSSSLLSEKQKEQCITMATLSAANTKYTAEQLAKATGVSVETFANWGLVESTDALTISQLAEKASSDAQAKTVLDKIIAQNAQAVANGEVTISNIAIATSEASASLATGAFTTAIKANISAMWIWMTTTPLGQLTLLATGVFAAVKAYDALTVSVEEQKEKVEKSLSAYEDAKSELSGITSELENQEQAMDDLLAKDKLTYTEKGQLEELQAITKELRIQKDLAEKEKDRTEKQLAKDATELFNKQFGDYNISENAIKEYQNEANFTGNNVILISDENDISAMIAGYRQFNELLDEAYGEGNQDDIDHFKSLTEDLEDNIFSTAQQLQTQQENISAYYEKIKDTPYDDLTTEQKEIVNSYNAISNAIALIYQQLDSNTWNSMQVDNIFSTDGIEKTKDELVETAKSGELTPETIKGYTNLNRALGETTLSAEGLCEEIYAIADAQKDVQGSTSNNETDIFTSFTDSQSQAIDNFQSKVKTLGDTLSSLQSDSLDNGTLTDLIQEFPELEGQSDNLEQAIKDLINNALQELYDTLGKGLPDEVKNDLQALADTASNLIPSLEDSFSAVQKSYEVLHDFESAMNSNSLTDSILSSAASLSTALNETVAGYYAGGVSAEELFAAVSDYYNTDLRNYAKALLSKNELSNDFYSNLGLTGSEIVNSFSKAYGIDLENCKNYSEAKEKIEKQTLGRISGMWEQYYDAQSKTYTDGMYLLWQQGNDGDESARELYTQIKKYASIYEEATDGLEDIVYQGVTANFESISASLEDAASAADKLTDKYKTLTDIIGSNTNLIKSQISLLETKGETVGRAYYDELINQSTQKLSILTEQYNSLKQNLANAMSNGVERGSEEWLELNSSVLEVQNSIIETKGEIEDFQNTINQLHWNTFNRIKEAIEGISDEAGNIIDLLESDNLLDEDGNLTNKAITQLALYAGQMEAAQYMINKYSSEIEYLNGEYAKGVITTEEYNEKLQELNEGQWDSVEAYNSAKKAIIDLRKNAVEEEIDALEELYDLRKKAWEQEKEQYDWEKTVEENEKNIAQLKSEISELANDNSLAGTKKRLELEAELEEAQSAWNEEIYDHTLEEREEALDEELEHHKKSLEQTLSDDETLLKETLDIINRNSKDVLSTLNQLSQEYGININTALTEPFSHGMNALSNYSSMFSQASSAFTTQLNEVSIGIYDLQTKADTAAVSVVSMFNSANGTLTEQVMTARNAIDELIAAIKNVPTEINIETNVNSADDAAKTFAGGGSSMFAYTHAGYASGTASASKGLHPTYENGLEIIEKDGRLLVPYSGGETVFNNEQLKNLWNFSIDPSQFIFPNIAVPDYSKILSNTSIGKPEIKIEQKMDQLIRVDGDMTPDVLQKISTDKGIIKKIKDIAMEGTVEAISSRGFKMI